MRSNEEVPLTEGDDQPQYSAKPPKHLFFLIFVLSITLVAVVIGMGVRISQLKNEEDASSTSPACPTSSIIDANEDFPIYPVQSWNISASATRNIVINNLTEGTWMNVDVSPDGTEIVFDLLGDLYLMNLNTEVVTPLRTGVSLDWQPRYHPDGNSILFTSDESGCDNLWVINKLTKVSFQVTSEPYRYVTDGSWDPSGASIIATKWITVTSRSIPAGEIWRFPWNPLSPAVLAPGAGTLLIGRSNPNNQIGPQEAVISPDGKYIYF